jgi:DNA-binding transcriptional regulator WhiA
MYAIHCCPAVTHNISGNCQAAFSCFVFFLKAVFNAAGYIVDHSNPLVHLQLDINSFSKAQIKTLGFCWN